MITFETALEYALLARPEIDCFTEYENAWVFDKAREMPTIGGESPVVIEKETGNWTFLTVEVVTEFEFGEFIREGEVPKEKRNRFYTLRDAVYGAAVGDALGVPWEFMTRDTFECTGMASGGAHNQPAGTFSDDTSMMLATCDSVKDHHAQAHDLRRKFKDWAYKGRYAVDGVVFDIGNTVATALSEGTGCDGEYSNGNGSLMRIAPLAYTWLTDDEIREASAVTHAHWISEESCVIFVHLLRKIIFGVPFEEALESVIPDEYEEFAFLHDVASWPREEVRSGGYVLDTLGAALWCFANTDSYADCVLAAVNLGSDSDTTACVAGALAGAYYGHDAIPAEWIEALRGKDIIDDCLFKGIENKRG